MPTKPRKKVKSSASLSLNEDAGMVKIKHNYSTGYVNRKSEIMKKPKGTSDKVWSAHSAVAKKQKEKLYPMKSNGTPDTTRLVFKVQKRK